MTRKICWFQPRQITANKHWKLRETLGSFERGGFAIVDSVAALTPQAEIDGDMGDSHMGLQARSMSQALRKLTGIINKSKATVIFINQITGEVR